MSSSAFELKIIQLLMLTINNFWYNFIMVYAKLYDLCSTTWQRNQIRIIEKYNIKNVEVLFDCSHYLLYFILVVLFFTTLPTLRH